MSQLTATALLRRIELAIIAVQGPVQVALATLRM